MSGRRSTERRTDGDRDDRHGGGQEPAETPVGETLAEVIVGHTAILASLRAKTLGAP
jgi:hypothetical protein